MNLSKLSGVYAIKSKDCDIYIGSSVDIRKRWNEHKSRLRNCCHDNPILSKVAERDGVDSLNLELLIICSKENLRFYEQLAIDAINPSLNVLKTSKHYLTEQWKRSDFRERNTERVRKLNKTMWRNADFVAKAKSRACVMQTPEAKTKSVSNRNKAIAERGMAYKNISSASSATLKRLHADPEFSKKHSQRKRSEMLERCKDKEFCAKRDKAAADANKKPILCITTGESFPSKNEAAKTMGISVSLISKQLRGLSTRTKLQWKYVNEQEAS